jgi:TetR/AcrR family transcriptional regulator
MTKATNPTELRRRDPERTRRQIMDAALAEFADHGFHGARVDRITGAVGCNARLLYHYFGSKEKLYVAALEHIFTDIRAQERSLALEQLDPVEAMRRFIEFTFDFFDTNPLFVKIARNENLLEARFMAQTDAVRPSAQPLIRTISAIIDRGVASGLFRRRHDPLQIYVTMVALSAFHLNNGHTLSAIFDTDLLSTQWRARRRAHAVAFFMDALTGGDEAVGERDSA